MPPHKTHRPQSAMVRLGVGEGLFVVASRPQFAARDRVRRAVPEFLDPATYFQTVGAVRVQFVVGPANCAGPLGMRGGDGKHRGRAQRNCIVRTGHVISQARSGVVQKIGPASRIVRRTLIHRDLRLDQVLVRGINPSFLQIVAGVDFLHLQVGQCQQWCRVPLALPVAPSYLAETNPGSQPTSSIPRQPPEATSMDTDNRVDKVHGKIISDSATGCDWHC